jgi:hypothetical protein
MRGAMMQIHQLDHAGKLHAAFPQARVCRLQKAVLWGSAMVELWGSATSSPEIDKQPTGSVRRCPSGGACELSPAVLPARTESLTDLTWSLV